MARSTKSAFVQGLASKKSELAEASQVQRTQIADDSELIELYGLKAGDRRSVESRLVSCTAGVHEEGNYEGLQYVNFLYQIVSGPGRNLMVGNYIPLYDRKTKEVTAKAMEWVYKEFQGFGYDTAEWGGDPEQIEIAANELTKEKTHCYVVLAANQIKTGQRAGNIAVNKYIGRVIADQQDSSQEEEVAQEEAPAPPKEEPKAQKPKANKKAPVQPEPEPEVEDDDNSDAAEIVVGSKVGFLFIDEESDVSEDVEGTVTAIEGDTAKITDGKYSYDIALEDLTLLA